MTKNTRKIAIALGVLVLLFVVANFGVNFWLKRYLPNYIKNNSDYKVSYKTLDIDLGTGNIRSTGITVASKNPNNPNVIGLDGTVDSLKISRLGIYDALFNKRINSSDFLMVKPNLKITLAKPINDKTGKKRQPLLFKNLKINDGNIEMLRHTRQKFLAVNSLNLSVSNLRMTEEDVEDKLPVVFDQYTISGNNFYFRPDNVYALKANTVTTDNGKMKIKDFELRPLLSYAQFVRYYPKKRNLFDFKTREMDFKDIVLKDNKVTLSEMRFEDPELKMYTTNVKPSQKQKDFKLVVNLQDVIMHNAKVQILKPNGNKLFSAGNLNMDVNKLVMDENTVKGNIPFSYEKFLITGRDLNYLTETQDVKVAAVNVNPKSADLRSVVIKPTAQTSTKTLADLAAKQISLKVNKWNMKDNKLEMDAQSLYINGLIGKIIAADKKPSGKKMSFDKIKLPLLVRNIVVDNSRIGYSKGEDSQTFDNLQIKVKDFEINEKTSKEKLPFKTGNYSITSKNFSKKIDRFYVMSAGLLKVGKQNIQLNNFALKPIVSRAQFIRMIPKERDLYDLKINQITATGNIDLTSENKIVDANQVTISGLNANIFRSKIPADDKTVKPLYSELLRKIKFPLFVKNTDIKNSVLVYEEDTKKSDGPGKLTFGNFNMNIKNLNSAKMNGRPTQVPITINCSFMNISPMRVNWSFDPANTSDAFSISGNISDLPASSINPFVEPYLKIQTTGFIRDLVFNFRGNKAGLNGTLNMKHQDLKVAILRESGEKNKLLSAVANFVIKSNSGNYPESVVVDNVQRDNTKSFFNLFWKGIEEGLKKTLIGRNVEKTEEKVKNTVRTTKETVNKAKTKIQNTTATMKEKKDSTVIKVQETKKNLGDKLKGIFRKKEKAEN